jgi:hypothetical protein
MSVFELVLALVGTYSLLLVFYVLTGRGYIAEAYISSSKQLIYNDQLSSFHIIRFDNYICLKVQFLLYFLKYQTDIRISSNKKTVRTNVIIKPNDMKR